MSLSVIAKQHEHHMQTMNHLRVFTDSAIVLSMIMLSFIFVIACGLFEWKCTFFFIVCLYMYYCWRSSYQEGRVGNEIPFTGLIPPHFCAFPKQGLGFPTYMSRSLCAVRSVMPRGDCSFSLILVELMTITVNYLFINIYNNEREIS